MKNGSLIWFLIIVIICQGSMLYYLSNKLDKLIEYKAKEESAALSKAARCWRDIDDLINEKGWEKVE
jgi:hypothetical protein